MTAPTRTRRTTSSVKAATTTQEAPETTSTRPRRTTAAERAYARRAQRVELLRRNGETEPEAAPQRTGPRLRWPKSRASFVLIMMTLLAAGVATTLWLSTQAIADSYRLEQIRQDNAALVEQSELLQRDVTKQEAASSLAEKAKALGMVPAGDPARIVVNPDGTTTVVGQPKKATVQAPAPTTAPTTTTTPPPAGSPPVEGDVVLDPAQTETTTPALDQAAERAGQDTAPALALGGQ